MTETSTQSRGLRGLILATAALGLLACAPPPQAGPAGSAVPETTAVRDRGQQRIGDENHEKIVARFGIYDDARLTGYVADLGRRLVAVSEQPGERWTFTVLDSPTVNAFALPGGYVYVTRGLVGLANSEAELAGVIGHEIGHVTAGHGDLRQDRATLATGALVGATILGAVLGLDPQTLRAGTQIGQLAAGGILADYSRSDELAADNLGIRYLARAGFDPFAQADFLESMAASASLDAQMEGRTYNPNTTNFLASHPATAERTRQAIAVAQSSGEPIPAGAPRERTRFLSMIDGLVYGDSAKQGFVRGGTFSHPELRFTYDSPEGFRITNTAAAVIAKGPDDARFILDGGKDPGGALTRYIQSVWVPEIAKKHRVARIERLEAERISGLDAASGLVPVQIGNKVFDALLVAIRMDGRIYRLTGLAPRGSRLLGPMARAAQTFRRLSLAEARRLRPQRLDIVTVRRSDTVASLARQMNVEDFHEERFRVLNGLRPGQPLTPGDRVKIIR